MNLKNIVSKGLAILATVAPAVTLAQYSYTDAPPISGLGQVTNAVVVVVNWMIGIFWVLAVAFVIWAAFLYLTGGGDEDKIKTAKQKLIFAIVAAVIALLATGIRVIVRNLITGQGAT
jgi:hypothetical protein